MMKSLHNRPAATTGSRPMCMLANDAVPSTLSQAVTVPSGAASRAKQRPMQAGFTLFEVLLALGLSVVLLSAVYMALDLHWKYSMVGRDDMERSQLARAILQQMAVDIRCVAYQQPQVNSSSSSLGSTDDTGEDDGSETIMVEDSESESTASVIGLFGDSQTLLLHVNKPTRAIANAPMFEAVGYMPLSSDSMSIAYFLAGSGMGGLQDFVAAQVDDGSLDGSGGGQGLARLQSDRLIANLADEQGDLASLAANTRILAEEVEFLQFQYFDGVEWVDEWDCDEFGALPLAVGITLGFRPPPDTGSSLTARVVSDSTNQYRLVVALPLANPYETEAAY